MAVVDFEVGTDPSGINSNSELPCYQYARPWMATSGASLGFAIGTRIMTERQTDRQKVYTVRTQRLHREPEEETRA